MDRSQQFEEFLDQFPKLRKEVEALSKAHQPIRGNTIEATEDRIYFNQFAESPSILTTDAFTGSLGAIIYDTTSSKNAAPSVQFYKKSTMTYIDGILLVQFFPGQFDNGSATVDVFPTNVKVRLNGTRTRTTTAPYPADAPFYRINGGTVLGTYNPTVDGEVHTISLGATEIALLNNGVNSLAAQSDSSSDTLYGYAKMYLILSGYDDRS